jgi:hypothetical protein
MEGWQRGQLMRIIPTCHPKENSGSRDRNRESNAPTQQQPGFLAVVLLAYPGCQGHTLSPLETEF